MLPEEKHGGGIREYMQMAILWFSLNLAATNIITGFLGPLVFPLGWVDSVCIVIFATGLSACGASYTSTMVCLKKMFTQFSIEVLRIFQDV